MTKSYEPQLPYTTTRALPNPLEQQIMIYEAARASIKNVTEYLETKLDLGKLVETATTIKSYLHTPITDCFKKLEGYFFAKSANQKNREAKKRKERQQKKQEKQKLMKTPGGNSRYAKKSKDGNEDFWKGKEIVVEPPRYNLFGWRY